MLEEPARRPGVTLPGDEHVDDLPELVNRAVDVPPPAGDLHVGLVDPPAGANPMSTGACSLGQQRREPQHQAVDADVVDLDAAFGQQFFDVAVGQAIGQVPADGDDDGVGREAEAGEGRPRNGSRAEGGGFSCR
jgi:hypothetical protein